jgi:DNA transformation protein
MRRSVTALSPAARSENLTSLRDIGEVSARWLHAVGIHTVSELRRVGPAEAFGRVKFRFGRAANRNLLYALAMGLQGRAYNDATPAEKRRLCAQAGIPYQPNRGR